MIEAIMNYQFMQHAAIACVLASIVCGLIGVLVVEKKLIMMSGGIAHTAFGGVGMGYYFGFEPMIGAVIFSAGAAVGIGAIKRRGGVNTDIIIALLWSAGMAIGTAFIGFTSGYAPDMSSYLFGNILTVTTENLIMMAALTLIAVVSVLVFFNDWKTYMFDDTFAGVIGMKTGFLEYFLLILIALTVVVLIRVAGIILVIALLTAPAATASLVSKKLKNRMVIAVALSLIFCFAGLWISYELGIASGATIILLSVAAYALVYLSVNVVSPRIDKKRALTAVKK